MFNGINDISWISDILTELATYSKKKNIYTSFTSTQFAINQSNSIFQYSSNQKSLSRSNATQNHQISANCLRKCTDWNLSIHDSREKNVFIKITKNSGVALKQMNYEICRNLSKEQVM